MRDQLVRLLRSGVQTHRMVDILVFRERQRVARAVDAGTRRVDEVRDSLLPAAFDDMAERRQVVGKVSARIDERISDAGLRGKMHDLRVCAATEQSRGGLRIGEIDALEPKPGARRQSGKPGLFERDVVIRVEIVDACNHGALVQQPLGRVHADKTGATGDKHVHAGAMPRDSIGRVTTARSRRARGASRIS